MDTVFSLGIYTAYGSACCCLYHCCLKKKINEANSGKFPWQTPAQPPADVSGISACVGIIIQQQATLEKKVNKLAGQVDELRRLPAQVKMEGLKTIKEN